MPKIPKVSMPDVDFEAVGDALTRARGRVASSLSSLTRRKSSHNEALENYENQVRRDVYYNQQTGRAEIREPQTMFTRNIAVVVLSVLVYIIVWVLSSAIEFFFYSAFTGSGHLSVDLAHAQITTGNSLIYWDFFWL